MSNYNILVASNDATVVSEFKPSTKRATEYQSEGELEKDLISKLSTLGYSYVKISSETELVKNLREKLEELNNIEFSEQEWDTFFSHKIASIHEGITEKTRKIQDDYIQVLNRDDGSSKNIYLIDKKNIHNNQLQVINQFVEQEGTHESKYDVTILVNGLPLVHVELKRRGVAIREAFNQIRRYQRESFWASSGLFEYVQIFVISNGTHTKYYSNTTRDMHIKEQTQGARKKTKKTSNSFEFTSYWADNKNNPIYDLVDFTRTFFAKHTLLNILTKYCVFTADDSLLVMRPYQITATEKILNKILIAKNYKYAGSIKAGGYVWHTTGSGKTLTSFKTSLLAANTEGIDKVIFVVDRKDLDYQTMREYDKFEKGAANSNTSTRILQKQIENPDAKIIITTIQKLSQFIKSNEKHDIYQKDVVMIFDECHRSQFGEMHQRITKAFKKYYIFGFTGTPIFAVNSGSSNNPLLKTTEQAFGDNLHTYTIVNAIDDGNVLPFRIDYLKTMDVVTGSDKTYDDPDRVSKVTAYILKHFDQKTKRNSFYSIQGKRLVGFNSIFAVSSISQSIQYYKEFQRQLNSSEKTLNIATIFSFSPNEEEIDVGLLDESFDTDSMDQSSRDFLESAIMDYNRTFNTNYDTSSDKFQNYYKDVSDRVKNREIDLLIVVNMFLTGFDATTVNTLWVDKNLRYHGLIQAFSRTNRILNSVKTFGNIVCFRDLQEATDEALSIFGNKDAHGIVLLKSYKDYYFGYDEKGKHYAGYTELIEKVTSTFPVGQKIEGKDAQEEFVRLFGQILRTKNILTAFDEFEGNEILSERDFQDYQSMYIDIYDVIKRTPPTEGEDTTEGKQLEFELELIRQVEVTVDYILMLIAKFRDSNFTDKEIRGAIDKAISSTISLRNKKELIENFIGRSHNTYIMEEEWANYVKEQREEELGRLIEELKLKEHETKRIIKKALREGYLKTSGLEMDSILPPISRFTTNRYEKKNTIIESIVAFFEKYVNLV